MPRLRLERSCDLGNNNVVKNLVADETRTRELVARAILENGPATAGDLASRLEITPAGVRRHLEDDTSAPLWDLRRGLIAEEFQEFIDSFDDIMSDEHDPAHTIKELADLIYVSYGYAATYGWDLDEALNRVHKSNMSKLGDDGKPVKRLDGKVIKGPNYKPPHMDDLV